MDTPLDDEGLVADRPITALGSEGGRSFRPSLDGIKARFSLKQGWRPLLTKVAGVLVLGGALGAGGYFLSNLDSRTITGLLDVGDDGGSPRLAFEMPSRDGRPRSDAELPPGLINPPAAAMPSQAGAEMFKNEVIKGNPKATEIGPYVPKGGAPAAGTPGAPGAPAVAGAAPAAPAPVVVPAQPAPRTGDHTPSYANLPNRPPLVDPLPPVPVDSMIKVTPNGPLPIVSKDGRQAWQVYARPYDGPTNQPRIAVVVANLGLEKDATDAAIDKLPPEVTLAFNPYAAALDRWVRRARDAGHEVLLMLPTEPAFYPARDPGPWGLLTSNPAEENLTRLEKVLGRAPGYVGVITTQEGPFMRSVQMNAVMQALKERGLMYVGAGAKGETLPALVGAVAEADLEPFRDAVDARLAQVANTARQSGKAVAVVSARPLSLSRVAAWIEQSTLQDLVLAPVSALAAPPVQGSAENGGKH